MSRTLILIILTVGTFLAACKKDHPQTPAADESMLTPLRGQWQWIRQDRYAAVIGGADSVITAKNLGITEFLNMNADLTWSLVSNGYTLKSGNFRVDTPVAFTDAAGTPVYLLDFVISGKDSDVDHWLSADNDTLRTAYTIVNPTFNVDTYVRSTTPVTQEH